jgi:hypothetical protein
MKKIKLLLTTILLIGFSTAINAQNGDKETGVGEFMRSHERSYVVVAVMLTILAGVVIYLVRIDRKISKLEKEK